MTSVNKEPEDFGGVVGFDGYGKLRSVAWIDPRTGLTERQALKECAKGGLAVRKATTAEVRQLMILHKWVKAPRAKKDKK